MKTLSNAKKWRAGTLCALMLCSVMLMGSMVGCTPGQVQQTEQVINLVVNAASNLAAVADPGAAWVVLLPGALNGLKTAEADFQSGSGAAVVVSNALLAVEDVISGVEPGSKASELADILTTAIDAALLVFPPASTLTPTPPAPSTIAGRSVTANSAPLLFAKYNHHGRAKIAWMPFRSPAGNIRATWNAAVKKRPQLSSALLK